MGEVYRATDTTLGRDVAIKVLPAEVAQDEERLARFRREAQLLAALNHPNIGAIYGLEESEGQPFLVLELVEGEELKERLERGPIPVDEAVEIARQIAEGLEGAHDRGVVHRDLKPANVKLTPDGKVKVLDFGLAKAWAGDPVTGSSSDLSQSPTLAHTGTQAGVILGTAAYMSPEQARGRPVDKRADIWAFGAVLFEMLTGRPLFTGETVSDILAAVLTREPEWSRLPAATPPSVRRVLHRCLQRDPGRRLHDIADARLELEESSGQPLPGEEPAPSSTGRRRRLLGVGALLLAVVGAFAAGRLIGRTPAPRSHGGDLAFVVRAPGDGPAVVDGLALSRDGRRLVFRSSTHPGLLVRDMNAPRPRPIPGTNGAEHPFLSPDGEWLGFFAGGKLRKVAFEGGDPLTLCDAPGDGPGAAWGLDGSIYFTPTYFSGLLKVDASGGTPVPLTTPDRGRGEAGHMWADPLPGGKALVFTVFGGSGMNGSKIAVLELESGRYEILEEGAGARYVASGHLVFYRRGAHYAVPFDPATRRITGVPRAVLRDVRRPDPTGDRLQLAFSTDGRLAYVPGDAPWNARASRLARLSPDGSVEPLPFEGVHVRGDVRLSPDGERVAVTRWAGGETHIWIYDLARGTQEKLTGEGVHHGPAWHPDGKHVGYTSLVDGTYDIWWSAVDGSRPPAALVASSRDETSMQWSPDGRSVVFEAYSEQTGADLELLPLDAPGQRRSLVATPLYDAAASLSRDGRWLAYRSGDALYVSALSGTEARTLVGRGAHPLGWSRGTDELFFVKGEELMAARITARQGSIEVGTPRSLLKVPSPPASGGEPSADGSSFLFLLPLEGQSTSDEIHVRVNGFEELDAPSADR